MKRREFIGLIGTAAVTRGIRPGGARAETSKPLKIARALGDLRGPWILFVDNHCVAELINVKRTPHAFVKHKDPVLKGGYIYGTVLPTEKRDGYRMLYTEYTGNDTYRIRYATSKDGIQWQDGG